MCGPHSVANWLKLAIQMELAPELAGQSEQVDWLSLFLYFLFVWIKNIN